MNPFQTKANPDIIIAVPVRNEAEWLPGCLEALIRSALGRACEILVLINNSDDAGARIARHFAAASPVPISVVEIQLPAEQAHAGGARRVAMRMAAERVGADGILLTTDADGVVSPHWLENNLRALAKGAEAVAGRALIDPADEGRLPRSLIVADALECRYAALLDEIASRIDPDPADPWPRHDEHSGASIAVTARRFWQAGGIPNVPVGEDRAFFQNLRMIDARIRHDPEVSVTVSGRTEGRAAGGMADTIRRRLVRADAFLDGKLEPAANAMMRMQTRRRARTLWQAGARADSSLITDLSRDLLLPCNQVADALALPYFGAAWAQLEGVTAALPRLAVPVNHVEREIQLARAILAALPDETAASDSLPALTARDSTLYATKQIQPVSGMTLA